MMIWNDCKMIYEDGELHEECVPGTEIFQAYLKYCNNISKEPLHPVWYDMEENVCFGQDQTWLNSTSRNSFFLLIKIIFYLEQEGLVMLVLIMIIDCGIKSLF